MSSPILRVDHVSIAVQDRLKAENFFRTVLGAVPCTSSLDPYMKYTWEIMALGDLSRIEILSPTSQGSFLDGFLKEKWGGVHHVTLQTRDIEETKELLRRNNVPFFGEHSYYDVLWKEIYIHPRDAFGLLIQIAEFHAEDWLSDQVKMPRNCNWMVQKTDSGAQVELAHPGGGKMKLNLTKEEAQRLAQELLESCD